MPSVQVRNMPDNVYNNLVKLAKQDKRSIAKETIYLLEIAMNLEVDAKTKRKNMIDSILKVNEETTKYDLPDPTDLIRKDRDR